MTAVDQRLSLPGVTGLKVNRRFTTEGEDPFASFTFVTRDAVIRDFKTGDVKFQLSVEVPDFWQQTSVDVLASKYCRKAGVPQVDASGEPVLDPETGEPVLGAESSARQVMMRLANAWMLWGQRGGYFASEEDAVAFRDEMAYMLRAQIAAPNSPQWFNTGLFEAYGIVEDPEGNWYFDEVSGELRQSAHKYERPAVSACYILGVEDNLVGENGILDLMKSEATLFKAGSGSGASLSNLRERGAPLTGGGTSSGVMSFAKAIDRMAGSIKSGGNTRRAAKMVVLSADHPDIEEFIESKVEGERVARALIAQGYVSDYDAEGGAYDLAPFQNANHSVRIPRGFMELVESGGDLELISRKDGRVLRTIPARKLWDDIAEAAWFCADPGLQFDGIINDWATTPNDGRINASNPCSEYLHVDNTACNLASLNLGKFFDSDLQTFDTDLFEHAVRLWTLTLEISVSMTHYPTRDVAFNSYEHRTLGLGVANLGALLMRAGLPYDSREGRAVMGAVASLMNSRAYATSAEIADAVGPCVAFSRNQEPMLRVLRNHRRAAYGTEGERHGVADFDGLEVNPMVIDHRVLARTVFSNLTGPVLAAADEMVDSAVKYGVRNMQATVIAPTGTIGLLMDCDTTGCEPDFALVKWKKLVGGGTMKIVNQSVPAALHALGYDDDQIRRIVTYALGTQTLAGSQPVNRASLTEAGVPSDVIDRVEAAIPTSGNLGMAFAPHVVGDMFYVECGLDPSTSSGSELLGQLGFTLSQVLESSKVICGHETVEGAPDLRAEDLPVFDTANYCGDGTRVIHWSGHVLALAALQPHLSGASSKTVNLPADATVDDIREVHELAYRTGVKAIAVYRDGCKASQPLNRTLTDDDVVDDADGVKAADLLPQIVPGMSPSEYYQGVIPPRFKLPHMRTGRTFSMNVGGMDVYVQTGEFDDGTLGEIWVNLAKDGSTLRGVFSQFAIAVSLGLQRGVPLEQYVEKFVDQDFAPNGIVTGSPYLKMARSIPDALFRTLGAVYLGRTDLVQVPDAVPVLTDPASGQVQARRDAHVSPAPEAADVVLAPAAQTVAGDGVYGDAGLGGASPYTGNLCPECHSPEMVKNGACERCLACGATTGCS